MNKPNIFKDALMRITLNIHDIRKIDANVYTQQYIERDGHVRCDSPFDSSPNSRNKKDDKSEGEELSISPYSNIF